MSFGMARNWTNNLLMNSPTPLPLSHLIPYVHKHLYRNNLMITNEIPVVFIGIYKKIGCTVLKKREVATVVAIVTGSLSLPASWLCRWRPLLVNILHAAEAESPGESRRDPPEEIFEGLFLLLLLLLLSSSNGGLTKVWTWTGNTITQQGMTSHGTSALWPLT